MNTSIPKETLFKILRQIRKEILKMANEGYEPLTGNKISLFKNEIGNKAALRLIEILEDWVDKYESN